MGEVFADVEVGDIENYVEQGEGSTGVFYYLVREPEVFGTGDFDFLFVRFLFPLEEEY
jgi:hypothetical protein